MLELLLRVFIKFYCVYGYIDVKENLLLIDVVSVNKVEQFMSYLCDMLGMFLVIFFVFK